MATSSIFSTVNPKDKTAIRKLVSALERSEATKVPDVQMTRPVSEFTTDQIAQIFGEGHDRVQNRES